MDMELYAELEYLGLRLDGLTNMSGLLSDAVTEGPNTADTYVESITLLSFLMSEFRDKYDDIMKRIPRGVGVRHE